jgi:glycosyltransferase involved in cell wall biosynthesis
MRIALVTPHYLPSVRGNSITVQRLEAGLRGRGLTVQVCALDRQEATDARTAVRAFAPDLVHGFHARSAGPLALQLAAALGVPSAVTLTGTDVNQDLFEADRRATVLEVLRRADALVAFHASIRSRVVRAVPEAGLRVHVIAQAATCRDAGGGVAARLPLEPGTFLVFQAAGLRRVKNIPSIVPPLAAVHARYLRLRYLLVGPVIEPEEHARLEALLRGRPWACYLGSRPHEEACALLARAAVAINSSLSEGGMSNAVLEAMRQGVPVLASDIEGNRSVIEDGRDGLLYRSPGEFAAKLERLLCDPALGPALGARAREKAARDHSPAREIEAHVQLYESLIGTAVRKGA